MFFSSYKRFVLKGFVGDIFSTLISVLTSLSIVNYLDDALYGSYIYGVAIAMPLITFTSISSELIILSDNKTSARKDILYSRILLALIAIPVLFLISYLDKTSAIPWFLLGSIYFVKLLDNISRILYSYLYLEDKIRKINFYKIFNQLFLFFGLGIFSVITQSISIGLLITFFLRIALILYQIYEVKHLLDFKFSKLLTSKLEKYHFLLGAIPFFQVLNLSIPKIVSQNLFGVKFVGVIGAVVLVPSFLEVISTSINKTIRNRLSKMIDDSININKFLQKIFVASLLLSFFTGSMLLVFQNFLELILSDKVNGQIFNILLILLGIPFLISSHNYYFILIKLREFKTLLTIQIFFSFVTLVLSLTLISTYEFFGYALTYLFFSLICYFVLRYQSQIYLLNNEKK